MSWLPERVVAAGVGEEGLLEVLLAAGRGSGGVEEWCWVEGELGASIYSRPEAVAENGITPASDYGEAEVGQKVKVTRQLRFGPLAPFNG